jgi:hypothetical protein
MPTTDRSITTRPGSGSVDRLGQVERSRTFSRT